MIKKVSDGRTDRLMDGQTDKAPKIERQRARERESAHERIDDKFADAFRHQNARNCLEILKGIINKNDDDDQDVAMTVVCSQWKTQN